MQRNLLSLGEEVTDVSNMLNILVGQNLTKVEILNWLENDEGLLQLEDKLAISEHHDSDNEDSDLNETN